MQCNIFSQFLTTRHSHHLVSARICSVSAKLHFHFLTLLEYFVNNKQNLAETGHISVEAIEIHINILAEAELNQLNG